MRIGLSLMSVRPDRMPEFGVRAEELGYESVFAPDHVVLPVTFSSRYPGTNDGEFPLPHTTPLYDPWIALMQVAQVTNTIKLGTAIYVLALRHPILSARAVTTVDVLSHGRTILGIGAGWLREEYRALGIEPRTRFERTEEAVEAIRLLWSESAAEYHGQHFDFDAVHFEPKPVSTPNPPILFGGYSNGALQRAVRLGDGWLSGGGASGVEDVGALMKRIGELREQLEISRPFQVTILHSRPDRHFLDGMAALGVHRVIVMPWTRNRDAFAAMESFAEEAAQVLA